MSNYKARPQKQPFLLCKTGGVCLKGIAILLCWVTMLSVSARADAKEKERTPTSLLSAIEQRSQELEKRAKAASLKEQRLRILEQEISQKLEEIKKVRDGIAAKEEAEKKAKAMEKAKKAKAIADAKKAMAMEDAKKAKVLEEKRKEQAFEAEKAKAIAEAVKGAKNQVLEDSKKLKDAKKDAKKAAAKAAAEKRLARAKAAATKRKAKAATRPAQKKVTQKKVKKPDLPPEKLQEMAAVTKQEAARKALEEKRFKDLARVYDKMPPAEAALRLQNMNEVMALEIIPRMNKAKLARVLSSMDPVMAVRYTERIGMGGPFFPTDTPSPNPPPSKAEPPIQTQ